MVASSAGAIFSKQPMAWVPGGGCKALPEPGMNEHKSLSRNLLRTIRELLALGSFRRNSSRVPCCFVIAFMRGDVALASFYQILPRGSRPFVQSRISYCSMVFE